VTLSVWVISLATRSGTPTSFSERVGSGEMTVRAEKLTRFPDREPRKRPSFPFSRWLRVLRGRPERCRAGGVPLISLSTNVVTWYWSSSQRSSMISCGAPASRFSMNRWLIRMMSTSLCVRSSSERWPLSSVIEGRVVTGGTGSTVMIIHSGRECSESMPRTSRSSSGMSSNQSRMSEGISLFMSSSVRSTSSAFSMARRSSFRGRNSPAMISLIRSTAMSVFSWGEVPGSSASSSGCIAAAMRSE